MCTGASNALATAIARGNVKKKTLYVGGAACRDIWRRIAKMRKSAIIATKLVGPPTITYFRVNVQCTEK